MCLHQKIRLRKHLMCKHQKKEMRSLFVFACRALSVLASKMWCWEHLNYALASVYGFEPAPYGLAIIKKGSVGLRSLKGFGATRAYVQLLYVYQNCRTVCYGSALLTYVP